MEGVGGGGVGVESVEGDAFADGEPAVGEVGGAGCVFGGEHEAADGDDSAGGGSEFEGDCAPDGAFA
ncbi:Uncharacterised protein [Dermatophilus congolensis]|uniref:Uncharacterized protein n=1 Tax=Dermatophilus congolensis TaxID=1863 RepID=A0A239V733_9MICO|nr:Uncharacterised protein [Dermatophilus congolensis]